MYCCLYTYAYIILIPHEYYIVFLPLPLMRLLSQGLPHQLCTLHLLYLQYIARCGIHCSRCGMLFQARPVDSLNRTSSPRTCWPSCLHAARVQDSIRVVNSMSTFAYGTFGTFNHWNRTLQRISQSFRQREIYLRDYVICPCEKTSGWPFVRVMNK